MTGWIRIAAGRGHGGARALPSRALQGRDYLASWLEPLPDPDATGSLGVLCWRPTRRRGARQPAEPRA